MGYGSPDQHLSIPLSMRVELRPLLLFVSAYAINASVHEAAHALAAYTRGIPARL
jgi:hypothetical protein